MPVPHEGCVFCRIAAGQLEADIVYATDDVVVIRDLDPQAPTHYLAIPRVHTETLNEASPEMVGGLYAAAQHVARVDGFAETGYRTVINVHRQGGQSVWHLHLHILAGRPLGWPPG